MRAFWRKSPPTPEPVRLPLPWSHLTLDSWRASDVRVQFTHKLLASRMGMEMMSVLQNTMPVPDISDASRAGLEAARVRGYQQCLATILQMQVPLPAIADLPEPTYETPVEDTMLDKTG